jgi:hypothetical protein
MKFHDLLKKLKASEQFQSFSHAYKDPVIVAGFFVIDFDTKKDIHQIDYYIAAKKKIAAFSIDGKVTMQLLDSPDTKEQLKELNTDVKTDLDELVGIIDDEMKNRGITETVKKIVAVLHMNAENKRVWNLNCMLSGMSIVRAHIDDESKTVLKMERVSLFDVMKTMPGMKNKAGTVPKAGSVPATQAQEHIDNPQGKKMSPADRKTLMKSELDKLNKLEDAIEKEKVALNKELAKSDTKSKKK